MRTASKMSAFAVRCKRFWLSNGWPIQLGFRMLESLQKEKTDFLGRAIRQWAQVV
jgi:hypothetical protein